MAMAKRADEPTRSCFVTRRRAAKEELVRFVVDPTGEVRADVAGRLPGRGMWLSAERDVVDSAVGRNLFARAARRQVRVDPDLAEEVGRLLAARVLDGLGLARRAGEVIGGFEKVRAALGGRGAAVLVEASDAAADGRRKLQSLAPHLPVIVAFDRSELGRALGRDEVVHVAVSSGVLARRLVSDARRLDGFRPGALDEAARAARSVHPEVQAATGLR
jgi:predicted RNA-binding protein YlxR (DUF448 family)